MHIEQLNQYRINLPLFSTVVPAIIFVFLSCRPFVAITTLTTGLVGVEVTSVSWLGQLTVKEIVDNLSELTIRGHRWLAFSAVIRDLEVALIQTKEDLLQLQQSLDMTVMGKLSTTLV